MKYSITKLVYSCFVNSNEITDERVGSQKILSTPIFIKSKLNLLNRSTIVDYSILYIYKGRLLSIYGDHAGEWLLVVQHTWDFLLVQLNIEYYLDIC